MDHLPKVSESESYEIESFLTERQWAMRYNGGLKVMDEYSIVDSINLQLQSPCRNIELKIMDDIYMLNSF